MTFPSHGRAILAWCAPSLLVGLSVFSFGCAGVPSDAPGAAAARGQALAEQSCSSCHGMGRTGESAWAGAPAFRDMRFDYNAISYERRVAQTHMGRDKMPPEEISLEDVLDLRAYARSLRKPGETPAGGQAVAP